MHDSESNPCLSRKSGENMRIPQGGKASPNEETKDWEDVASKNGQQSTTESQPPQAGLARRAVGGLFSLGAGVVGAGFGGVKWVAQGVASTTYSVGSGVIAKVRPGGSSSSKDKND